MVGLARAQVGGELGLERRIGLAEVVQHHDVFGRNRAVRLQLECPMTGLVLLTGQRRARRTQCAVERSCAVELFDLASQRTRGRLREVRVTSGEATIQSPDLPSERRAERS